MRKIIIILLLIISVVGLSGCTKKDSTKIHSWTSGSISYQLAEIIYEIYAEPIEVDNGCYFEKDDIVLNIKYGWNEDKIENPFLDYERNNYKLICFATYFYLQQANRMVDDYKNIEDGILIEEIEKDVFLSDYYRAKLGKSCFLYTEKPTFSKENEGIKLKLTSKYIEWIENSTNKSSKEFKFAVFAVYYNYNTNKYELYDGDRFDGIEILYHYNEEKKLVYMYAH